jgi:hypothetical protein
MPVSKSFILKGCIGYAIVALILVLMLQIKDEPGKPTMRFTCDQMRPWVAGLAALAAISAWNWVSGTARETWYGYTRHWAMSFMVVLLAGLGLLVHFGQLSKEQGAATLMGIAIGALIGTIRVISAVSKNERIEF